MRRTSLSVTAGNNSREDKPDVMRDRTGLMQNLFQVDLCTNNANQLPLLVLITMTSPVFYTPLYFNSTDLNG
jgi:hypothetical protein